MVGMVPSGGGKDEFAGALGGGAVEPAAEEGEVVGEEAGGGPLKALPEGGECGFEAGFQLVASGGDGAFGERGGLEHGGVGEERGGAGLLVGVAHAVGGERDGAGELAGFEEEEGDGFGLGAGLEDEAGELREGVDGFREGGDNFFYLCDFGVEVGGFSKSRASEAASRWAVSWVRRLWPRVVRKAWTASASWA